MTKEHTYTDAVEAGLKGLKFVSVGTCPDCPGCEDFSDEAGDEGSFSHEACGICNSSDGGDRYVWHAVLEDDETRSVQHFDDACPDCLMYIANGEEPTS